MAHLSVKEQMIKLIQALPDDTTVEAAMDRLLLLYKIEQGLEDVKQGRVVPQEEARRRMEQWLK